MYKIFHDLKFQCSSRQCLKRHLVCDGIINCNDGSDEDNCGKYLKLKFCYISFIYYLLENWQCNSDEISCGVGKRCIPSSWKCDGRTHCLNGLDEQNCNTTQCSVNFFHCEGQGTCIPSNWRCDGKSDCSNGEDEKSCGKIYL